MLLVGTLGASVKHRLSSALLRRLREDPYLLERVQFLASPPSPERVLSSHDAYDVLGPLLEGSTVEHLAVAALNRRYAVLSATVISVGNASYTIVDPREIFRWALQTRRGGAQFIVIGHNHPSGDPTPSPADVQVTKRVCEAGALLGVKLLDHLVLGDAGYMSMADRGTLPDIDAAWTAAAECR